MEGNNLKNQLTTPRAMLGASALVDTPSMRNLRIDDGQELPNTSMNQKPPKLCGTSEREKMFIFTGTVERAIKWNQIFCNHDCYYEIIASVLTIQEGSVKSQMIMLLRDKKGGPILQMIYYTNTHINLPDFYIGQTLRCVGRMNGRNLFNAVSIRAAYPEEINNLLRLCCICDQAVSQHYLNVQFKEC